MPNDRYSLARPAGFFAYSQRVRHVVKELSAQAVYPLGPFEICEVGCGTGQWLIDFVRWGARQESIRGIDLKPESIEIARSRVPGADLRIGDADQLPWPDGSCDLVLQSTVLTSILDPAKRREVAREMLRVVKSDGLILWYDFRYDNPRNPTVRGIEKAEIRSLFPDCGIELRRVTLAPPLARGVVPVSWIAALLLEKVPLLRTHYLGVIRKRPLATGRSLVAEKAIRGRRSPMRARA